MYRTLTVLFLTAALLGCGGNASSPGPSTAPPVSSNNPPPGSGSPASSPNIVQLAAGQTAAGADITVTASSSSTALNARNLGVAPQTGQASASNTGATIHRGSTMRVLLFGSGLGADTQVSIRGPNDIQVSPVTAITATDNVPGISFLATVASDAALGCRTVALQNAKGDITTFTGGLEVVP